MKVIFMQIIVYHHDFYLTLSFQVKDTLIVVDKTIIV